MSRKLPALLHDLAEQRDQVMAALRSLLPPDAQLGHQGGQGKFTKFDSDYVHIPSPSEGGSIG